MSTCELRSHIVDSQFYGGGYTTPEARKIFCDKYRYQRWMDIEVALASIAKVLMPLAPDYVERCSRLCC